MNKVVVRKMGERMCGIVAKQPSNSWIPFRRTIREKEREKEIEEDEQDKNARAFWIATLFLRL